MTNYVINAIITAANAEGIPPKYLLAMARVESSMNPKALNANDGGSPSFGLFQIKVNTALQVGINARECNIRSKRVYKSCKLFGARTNAKAAAKYLAWQLKRYDWNMAKAISAYNAGSFRGNYKYWLKVKEHL